LEDFEPGVSTPWKTYTENPDFPIGFSPALP
jgi:hypothetical protein